MVPVEPGEITTVDGDAAIAKSDAVVDITVKLTVVEWDIGPLEPVTVSGYTPAPTVPGTKTVSADDAVPPGDGVTGFALKDAVIPDDAENDRVTGESKLLNEPTMTFALPDEP